MHKILKEVVLNFFSNKHKLNKKSIESTSAPIIKIDGIIEEKFEEQENEESDDSDEEKTDRELLEITDTPERKPE